MKIIISLVILSEDAIIKLDVVTTQIPILDINVLNFP
jgi:hypothetical protein